MVLDTVLPLADPQATLEIVGGKGASLARLSTAGLPVPSGFHVTTAAYRQFVAENDLQPGILAALEAVDLSQPSTLETASRAIRTSFSRAQMPPAISGAVARAYSNLPGDHPAVAVRSSATAEDLPDFSFAGQQETILNVHGIAAVLEAVRECWASLWTARAIGYRARHGVDQEGVSLAVVVQDLVPAEAAGVLFSANPVTGQRDQTMISASWGLGEAVVGGLVTPDTLTVDKATGRVLARETADKQVMTVRLEGGTEQQPVPEPLRRASVLDDSAAAELVRLGVQIERLYGGPTDIEWALVDGKFFILQARPITALQEPPVPVEWPLPNPKGQYYRTSVVDFMPDPLSPLFATLGLPFMDGALNELVEELTGLRGGFHGNWIVTVNDYAYVGLQLTARQWGALLFRMMPAFPRLLRTGEQRWRQVALPHYSKTVARWQTKPLAERSASELLAGTQELLEAMAAYLTTLQSGTMGAAAGSEALFTTVYEKLVRRPGDPAASTFLLGFESTPIRAEKALYDLGQWCRTQPGLANYLSDTPAAQLVRQLGADEVPVGVDGGAWHEWQRRSQEYLQQFGHAIYDLDFAEPLPADDPTPALEALKMYVAGQGSDPHARQQELAERREAAVQAMSRRLRWLKRKIFFKVLGWAQRLAPLREDGIAGIGLGYPLLRRMLRELGRRFAQAGAFEVPGDAGAPDDIFWLTRAEVEQGIAALDRGQPLPSRAAAVQERKAIRRAEKRVAPPPQLPPSKKLAGISFEAWLPVSEGSQERAAIKGLGASPGRVTATARVLHGPEDFDQMRPGEVLVAAITTPAWTPLFAMASAVVTDVGGPLSHGSIVAREYGIPAVLGTGVATRRIQSGQSITVDGDAGMVTLAHAQDVPGAAASG